ncbi:MAG: POTRA domain-containing protein, partial [bacterium]
MPGDRPRTTPSTPSRSPGVAAALPLLSLALLGQGSAWAGEASPTVAPGLEPPQTIALASSAPQVPALPLEAIPGMEARGTTPASLPVAPPPPLEPTLMAQASRTLTPAGAAPPSNEPPGAITLPPDGSQAPPTSDAAPPLSEPFGSPSPNTVPPTPAAPEGQATPPVAQPQPTPSNEPRVLVSEVVIKGLDGHPEKERIERAAYAAMTVIPGTEVTRSDLKKDLAAIYATGWFSDVRMEPVDSALGVRLVVKVVPNPVLTKVTLDPSDAKVPSSVVQDTFAADYGKTINLTTLKTRIEDLQKWYADQGYSLARVTGPSRVSPDGELVLAVRQGIVDGVEVQFLNKEGSATNDKGQPI